MKKQASNVLLLGVTMGTLIAVIIVGIHVSTAITTLKRTVTDIQESGIALEKKTDTMLHDSGVIKRLALEIRDTATTPEPEVKDSAYQVGNHETTPSSLIIAWEPSLPNATMAVSFTRSSDTYGIWHTAMWETSEQNTQYLTMNDAQTTGWVTLTGHITNGAETRPLCNAEALSDDSAYPAGTPTIRFTDNPDREPSLSVQALESGICALTYRW